MMAFSKYSMFNPKIVFETEIGEVWYVGQTYYVWSAYEKGTFFPTLRDAIAWLLAQET